jgi:hypothetical protein
MNTDHHEQRSTESLAAPGRLDRTSSTRRQIHRIWTPDRRLTTAQALLRTGEAIIAWGIAFLVPIVCVTTLWEYELGLICGTMVICLPLSIFAGIVRWTKIDQLLHRSVIQSKKNAFKNCNVS